MATNETQRLRPYWRPGPCPVDAGRRSAGRAAFRSRHKANAMTGDLAPIALHEVHPGEAGRARQIAPGKGVSHA
jgi:hypothetical protein